MRTLGFEIGQREIREGQCGMGARTSNPFLSAKQAFPRCGRAFCFFSHPNLNRYLIMPRRGIVEWILGLERNQFTIAYFCSPKQIKFTPELNISLQGNEIAII